MEIRKLPKALILSVFDIFDKGYTYHSGALAFQMLLSLVPMMVIAVNVLPLLPFADLREIESFLIRWFPQQAQKVVQELLNLQQKGTSTSVIALGLAYFFSVGFIKKLSMSFRFITEDRFRERGELFFWVFMPLLFLAGVILFSLTFFLSIYVKLLLPEIFPRLLEFFYILPLGAIICILYASFLHTGFSLSVILVSYLTAGAVALVQWGFTLYVSHIFKSSLVYGSLSGVILFLVWLNFLFLTLITGARVLYRMGEIS